MMHDVLVQHLLHGGVDSPRPWKDEEKVTFVCPVPGYDRHFTMLASYGIEMVTVPMLDDGPGRRRGRGAGQGRPVGQGHVDRADLRQPRRVGRHPGGRQPARVDADGRARLPDLLGQRLRLPPPHRGRGEVGRHPVAVVGGRAPAPADHVRLDEQDHVCRCRRRVPRRLARDGRAGTSATSSSPRSARTRSTSCGTCSSSGRRRACATTCVEHRAILAPKFAAVDAALTAGLGGPGRRRVDPARRRLLRQPRRAGRLRRPGSSRSPRRPASRSPRPGRPSRTARTRATATSGSPPPSPSSARSRPPWRGSRRASRWPRPSASLADIG